MQIGYSRFPVSTKYGGFIGEKKTHYSTKCRKVRRESNEGKHQQVKRSLLFRIHINEDEDISPLKPIMDNFRILRAISFPFKVRYEIRFRLDRPAADMEGNGEFDFCVVYEVFLRIFKELWRNIFVLLEIPSIRDQQKNLMLLALGGKV